MALHQETLAAAPTLDQARIAAEALADEGAAKVLLFGSLSRGEARPEHG